MGRYILRSYYVNFKTPGANILNKQVCPYTIAGIFFFLECSKFKAVISVILVLHILNYELLVFPFIFFFLLNFSIHFPCMKFLLFFKEVLHSPVNVHKFVYCFSYIILFQILQNYILVQSFIETFFLKIIFLKTLLFCKKSTLSFFKVKSSFKSLTCT